MDVKSQLLNLKSIIRVFEEIYSTKKKKKKKKKKNKNVWCRLVTGGRNVVTCNL
jgi:hypothetical protein